MYVYICVYICIHSYMCEHIYVQTGTHTHMFKVWRADLYRPESHVVLKIPSKPI